MTIEPVRWTIDLPTPKQLALRRQAVMPKSTLADVATDLARSGAARVFFPP